MHSIARMPYGFHLVFAGKMDMAEMQAWLTESKRHLATAPAAFAVFVDMRNLQVLDVETQAVMRTGQAAYKSAGMQRSVVILANPIVTMQFKRIAKESGIYAWERYIDASKTLNWEQVGVAWLEKAADPDAAAHAA